MRQEADFEAPLLSVPLTSFFSGTMDPLFLRFECPTYSVPSFSPGGLPNPLVDIVTALVTRRAKEKTSGV